MHKFELLRQKIEQNGWSVEIVDTPTEDWWVIEAWELTSIWSPVGKRIFIVLVCDPQSENEDSIEEKLLSISISNQMPEDWDYGGEFYIYIKPKWERGLKEFCEALPKFREQL